jgi:hypothetical protein
MFALDKGYLPLYLKAFRNEEAALKKPGFILDNLRYAIIEYTTGVKQQNIISK